VTFPLLPNTRVDSDLRQSAGNIFYTSWEY